MSSRVVTWPQIEEEGDRMGAKFRLGQRTGAWRVRHWSPRTGLGVLLVAPVALGGVFLPIGLTGIGRVISAAIESGMVVAGMALIFVSPVSGADRLYRYTRGIALHLAGKAEPAVLRWTDLEEMTLASEPSSSDDDYGYRPSCVLRDRSGQYVTVGRSFGSGLNAVIEAAELVLAPRLVPGLIARYDAGEQVTMGSLTVSKDGLTHLGAPPVIPSWYVPWTQVRRITTHLGGRQVVVREAGGPARRHGAGGMPNGFTILYLLRHAAGRAGVEVDVGALAWQP